VLMVESEAKELSEEVMLGAVMFGHRGFQPVIDAIIDLAEACAKDPWPLAEQPADYDAVKKRVAELAEAGLRDAYAIKAKQERQDAIAAVRQSTIDTVVEEGFDEGLTGAMFKKLEKDVVRGDIIKTESRIDGRDLETVRPIVSEVGILPGAHGSALFTRGETQALVVATLGTGHDEQIIEDLSGSREDPFMLHYNFPAYSVGETGFMSGPQRREIGHGRLARRGVGAVLPQEEDFPYAIRVVSEITESNGSSSMASVCGSSLALMDAGVPITGTCCRYRNGPDQGRRSLCSID